MLRDATIADHPDVLRLNLASVKFLSPMDADRLVELDSRACYFRVVELKKRVIAFLLGFRKGARYDSPNFQWFERQGTDFVYIDRIVVDESFRGRGLGGQLYRDIERFARSVGSPRLTAEIDIKPPNPVSLRFHDKWGFVEVGQHIPYGAMKTVSLREKKIESQVSRLRRTGKS